jgi:hypothetical protein
MKKVKAKKAPAKKAEVKIETIQARHDFSEKEIGELGGSLSGMIREKSRLTEEKKVVMKQWATRIEEVTNRINETSDKMEARFEMRSTECEVHFDWKAGKKTYVRKADGKQVDVQSITDPERQQKLFEENKEKNENALKPGDNIVSVKDAIRQAESHPSDEGAD